MSEANTPRSSPRVAVSIPVRNALRKLTGNPAILEDIKNVFLVLPGMLTHVVGCACSKNSISAGESSQIEKLIKAWAIHTPSYLAFFIMDSWYNIIHLIQYTYYFNIMSIVSAVNVLYKCTI